MTNDTKTCARCATDLPREAFATRRGRYSDGMQAYCRPCFRAYHAERKRPRRPNGLTPLQHAAIAVLLRGARRTRAIAVRMPGWEGRANDDAGVQATRAVLDGLRDRGLVWSTDDRTDRGVPTLSWGLTPVGLALVPRARVEAAELMREVRR